MTTKNIYTTDEYYRKNPTWDVEHSPWKAKHVISIIERNNLNLLSVAEVGCGAGEILNQLYLQMDENVTFTGYEISPDAFELCKERIKNRLNYKLVNIVDDSEHFDLLLVIDVIEHIEDYFSFIRELKNKADYIIFHIPLEMSVISISKASTLLKSRKKYGHIHYFSKDTALESLKDTGYNIIDFFYTPVMLDFPTKSINTKLLRLPRKIAYKYNRESLIRILGGFSLMVLASRKDV